MSVYLSLDDLLEIHRVLIDHTGGSDGIRDQGLLESALYRPQASFAGVDLYPNLVEKAAALFHSLILNHPFIDGNKRVAFTATDVYLRLHGQRIVGAEDALYDFVIAVADGKVTFSEVIKWMYEHTQKLSN